MVTGWPAYVTTWPAVAETAAFVLASLGRDALVHLRARVGVLVEAVADRPGARGDRVGARRDRLRLERLGRPRGRALGRDDAADVVLEADGVDRRDAAPGGPELEGAAVAPVAHARHRGPVQHERAPAGGVHAQRRGAREQRLRALADDEPGAAADHVVGLRGIERPRADPRGAGERVLALGALQQHPHLRLRGELGELRAGVVARQDRRVVDALQGEAVGAVLAHADAVPEARAADDHARGGMGRRGAREGEQEGERDGAAHDS